MRCSQTFHPTVLRLQIDIGAQWDALLPCREEEWEEAAQFLQPGDEVGALLGHQACMRAWPAP